MVRSAVTVIAFLIGHFFQNISIVFGAPNIVRDIINKFTPVNEPKRTKLSNEDTDAVNLDDDGNVEIPNEIIVGKSQDIFGTKHYEDIAVSDTQTIFNQIKESETIIDKSDELVNNLHKSIQENVINHIIKDTKESYGQDLRKSEQNNLEKTLNDKVKTEVRNKIDDFNQKNAILDLDLKKELQNCVSDEQVKKTTEKYKDLKKDTAKVLNDEISNFVQNFTQEAEKETVRAVEQSVQEEKKRNVENNVKDRLRGFARTIPSFLMAYGADNDVLLETFDQIIPEDVFKDVTSITLDQFRFLRDGGDYTNEETGEIEHFDGHIFDATVFNDSITVFIELKDKLSNYFDDKQKEDIFDYLTKITIDEDKPKQKVESIGTMSGFDSIVDCYADGDTLHIYNVNGGKVKAPVDSYRFFQSCTATSMDLKGLNVSNVENASYMFQNCTKLENVDVSNWNTSHMKNLEGLFYYCTSLKQADLNSWNISNAINLRATFYRCQQLVELKIDKWDVSKVKNFASIFGYCSNVETLNLKEWNTSSAETFYAMFDGCTHVKTLDVSNFDTSKVYSLAWMYSGTWNLNNIIGMENWNVNNVSSADHMFSVTHVSTLELPDFTQSRIRDITSMFKDNYYLESLNLTKLPMNRITNLTNAFLDCRKLKTIYVQNDYIPKSVIAQGTFNGCTSLVGGSGTKYDPTFIDSTAARIDGGINSPGYFTSISDKPLETTQTNESDMSETTGNEVRSVEAPAKEPDELETDSKQNESESQK